MAPPPPPRSLPEELVEEILLRFPPDDPARLFHAALVCKPWRAIVSGAGFRRRFREFHRTPPLLGFVSNVLIKGGGGVAEFVPTCSMPASSTVYSRRERVCVIDAHHGRVLLHGISGDLGLPWPNVLVVWDPTTDVQEEVPVPDVAQHTLSWTAAVLCAAGGPCDHLDCRRGPFFIVFVGYNHKGPKAVLCTYSSSTASWSKPMSSNRLPFSHCTFTHVAHVDVESALYFGVLMTNYILKFDVESQQVSWNLTPATCSREQPYVLTTTVGGGLGLATILNWSKLYMWSRDDVSHVDGTWTQRRVIELKALLPVHAVLASPRLFAFTVGTGVTFVKSNNVLFVIDLKTYKVIKEVSMASEIYTIVPYMSFYTPAELGAVSTGEEP